MTKSKLSEREIANAIRFDEPINPDPDDKFPVFYNEHRITSRAELARTDQKCRSVGPLGPNRQGTGNQQQPSAEI